MGIRICHLLLCLVVAIDAFPQGLEHLQKGVVRVTAITSAGSRKEGSGFIVRLAGGSAHIVTAARVFVIDADGGKVTRLADSNMGMYSDQNDTAYSSWSPDGKRIAFTARRDGLEIRLFNVQEPGQAISLWQGQGKDQHHFMPAWSPDGKRIAFVSRRDGNPEIYVIDADGANPKRLTSNSAPDLWGPPGRPMGQ
jgi:Tol biopolymer transport system component